MVEMTRILPDLKRIYEKYNAPLAEINLFGIRHNQDQNKDVWNDVLGLMEKDTVVIWQGTTDPGKTATETKDGGAAHLCLGYHPDIWQVGIHAATNPAFAHRALVQTGNACRIWRDVNRNYVDDDNKIEEGYFGINFHRASVQKDLDTIGLYSFGCQVTRSHVDFERIMKVIMDSKTYKNNPQARFSYLLISETELNS